MDRASRLAKMITDSGTKSFNLITSQGAAATQTVMHLHLHLVPRTDGDGLKLPWSE
jgi:histidine triad (HIT) family protein